MSALRAYIKERSEGDLEARNQCFTLHPIKAQALLAEYQFNRPGDFLLKFVQASTIAAHGLTIIGNQIFEFWGWTGDDLNKLLSRLKRPLGSHRDDALSYLAQGLLTLASRQHLNLAHYQRGQDEGQSLTLHLGTLSKARVSQVARAGGIARGHSLLRITLSRPCLELPILRKFLDERCPWSRIRYEETAMHQGQHTLAALRSRRSNNSIPQHAQWRNDLPGWFVVEGQRLSKFARLRLFKHGVMLEEVVLKGQMGPKISLCADHLKTDLSGLRFIHDQAFEDAVKRGRELLSMGVPLPFQESSSLHRSLPTWTACLMGLLLAVTALLHAY